jgi:tRNA A-37 threonylcarbamoyl transferase component Bud32/cytoskeletal protein RodZ
MLHLEGREVGGCKLVRKIGEGGMGEVYLGEQIRVGNRSVAVKIVRADDQGGNAQIDDIARRFQREAALLGKFSHPNILPVHDSGVQGDLLYLVMQYAPDGSLADAIKGKTTHPLALPAAPGFVADLIGQVAAALQYTHERDVVHRDVKPGNVLLQLEPNGHWHALLADFGIARGGDASSAKTKVSGTLAYMAPEQFSGKFSPASDQYALAVMTYQLLTGHTPYEGDMATLTQGHIYGTPPSVRSFNAALPAAVDVVFARALAKDPAQRYPSVAEYSAALQMALSPKSAGAAVLPPAPVAGGRVSQGPAPKWPSAKPPREPRRPGLGRVWLALLAAAVLLVGIVGAGGLIMQRQQEQQRAQQTQTAHAAQTRTAGATQTAAAATATAVAGQKTPIPTATATPSGISDDVTVPPAPPSGVDPDPAHARISDPSPFCGQGAATPWEKSNNAATACPNGDSGGVDLTATVGDKLACIQRKTPTQTDGFVTAIAQPVKGSVVLAFRQGEGNTSGEQVHIKGYYLQIDPAGKTFQIYKVDADGNVAKVTDGTLSSDLNKHFAVGVLYKGDQITPYINGVSLGTVTDSSFTSGWMGLCTTPEGETIYSNALMNPLLAG